MKPSELLYREGSPMDRTELMKVDANRAKDILIMGSGGAAESVDQEVIQTLLALASLPGDSELPGDVFVEVQTRQSAAVAETILPLVGAIPVRSTLNQILVLRAVVSSIGWAFLEIVSFRLGNALYLTPVPHQLQRQTLGAISRQLPFGVVCGVVPAQTLHKTGGSAAKNDEPSRPCDLATPSGSPCVRVATSFTQLPALV